MNDGSTGRAKPLSSKEKTLLFAGLSPEPVLPPIVDIRPRADASLPDGVPVVDFADGEVITQWLHACPLPPSNDRIAIRFAHAFGDSDLADESEPLLALMKPLDPALIAAESYPDFTPAIDLRRMAGGADEVQAAYCVMLRNGRDRLLRVCHGVAGEGVMVRLFVNGVSVPHGGFVRLRRGIHALAMQTDSGKVQYAWQWEERRAAPRFHEVTLDEIRDLHKWRRSQWRQTWDAYRADESEQVRDVRIVPETVVGREGFIRVGRSANGLWWLLDAGGRPFYYRAMCSVNNRGSYGGRRKGDPLLPPERVKHWLGTIRQWGFNGLGSWTTREFFDQGLVYTEIIEAFYEGPYLQAGPYRHGVMPDVFDPRWAEKIERKCRALCAPLAQSRQLLGYFIDNERGFHLTRRPDGATGPVFRIADAPQQRRVIVEAEPVLNPEHLGLLQMVLSLDPEQPGARRGWEFIRERYGDDLAALSRAWGVALASRVSVNEMTVNGERLVSDGYLRDEADFVRLWVRQYFSVCVGAIRRHDPNHLVIGLRWAGIPDALVAEEEAKWSDIISLNRYRAEIVEVFDPIYRRVGKPIVIGEFCPCCDAYPFVRNPVEPPGGYESDDLRKSLRTQDSMDRICAHPAIVGYTYYAWKNGRLHPEDLKPTIQGNHRALSVRVARERQLSAPPGALPKLHGQVFLALTREGNDLTALGLICRNGEWDRRVYGKGVRGELLAAETSGETMRMEIAFRTTPGMFVLDSSEGRCTLELRRTSATELEGTFQGTLRGKPAAGTVMAYLHRPIPSPNV